MFPAPRSTPNRLGRNSPGVSGRIVCAVSFVCLAQSACGGNVADEATPPDAAIPQFQTAAPKPISEADFPSAYAHAVCDNIEACCGENALPFRHDDCIAAEIEEVTHVRLSGTFSPEAAGALVPAIAEEALRCTSAPGDFFFNTIGIQVGTGAPGDDCSSGEGCAYMRGGKNICVSWGSAGSGSRRQTCQLQKMPATVGDPCSFASGRQPAVVGNCDASTPLRCDGRSHTCQTRLAVGASCADLEDCVAGAYCNAGLCVAGEGAGGPCANDVECGANDYCDKTHVCRPSRPVGATCNGESCLGGICVADRYDAMVTNHCRTSVLANPVACGGKSARRTP